MKYITRMPALLVLGFLAIVTFGATSYAAVAATPAGDSSSLLDLLKPVYEAFAGGHYAYAAALVVIVLVALVKRYGLPGLKDATLHSDTGGTLLALVTAAAAACATALAAPGAHVTLALLKSALLVGVGAAGGFAVLKHLLIEPILKPLAAKAPAWAQPILGLVLWIFDKPDAVSTAEAAGAAAVAASPAQGVAGDAGKPTEVK